MNNLAEKNELKFRYAVESDTPLIKLHKRTCFL